MVAGWRTGTRRSLAASISLVLASASSVHAQQPHGQPSGATVGKLDNMLEEVTVTAQRRTQSVQDIPYNISVVGGDELARTGTTGFNELAHIVPGLTIVDAGPAARGNTNDFTLRGLRTDGPGGAGNNGTDVPAQTVNSVSTYFGETPVFFPVALHDIERVEVLRGPQGTLYGSGAQAGTVRFIPRRPSFEAFDGEVSASGSFTNQADGKANGSVDGVLNVPVSPQLALRVVAGGERLAGFINQVALWQRQGSGFFAPPTLSVPGDVTSGPVLAPTKKGTNSSEQVYARAAMRWQPAAAWDLQLDYLHQHTKVDDVQTANPAYPGGVENLSAGGPPSSPNFPFPYPFPNASFTVPAGGTYNATNAALQPYEDTIDVVSAVASVELGFATFTSATSFYKDDSYAATEIIGNFVIPGSTNFLLYPYYANYPRALGLETTPVKENSFTQEIRLVSNRASKVDYVVGAFYRNQRVTSDTHQLLPGITQYRQDVLFPQPQAVANAIPDLEFNYDRNTRFVDEALFGELTVHPTNAWQVTGGARFFRQSFDNTTVQQIPLCGSGCSVDPADPTGLSSATIHTNVNDHVLKLNTSYDLSRNTKVYATYSEGFRRGGANALPTTGAYKSRDIYETFQPDLAKNYEVGVKGTAFEQRLRFSADAFVIDLSNFQFAFSTLSGIPATFNGSKAQSKGTEIELQARISSRLNLSVGHAYTDATVKESIQLYDYGFCVNPNPFCLMTSLPAGARLPGVPKHTVTAALDYLVPLSGATAGGWSLNFHVDVAYRGAAGSVIDPTSRSYWVVPSSTIANLAVALAARSAWSYDLFINNLTDAAGYSGGRGTAQDPLTLQPLPNLTATRVVTRPRTVGLRARYRF